MTFTIHHGDAIQKLRELPESSVHCCITSPPYFGLRDYGVEGQIGLEPTPEEFIARLVEVFREVRRVLRDDGTLWVNMGDSYNNCDKWGGGGVNTGKHTKSPDGSVPSWAGVRRKWKALDGMKPKDLMGIPWMLAFALRADGWYLRQDIIWHKPNPMPESVKDRCTKAHEYIFMLSKSQRYWYDSAAVAERAVDPNIWKFTDKSADKQRGHGRRHEGFNGRYAEKLAAEGVPDTRNRRSVWSLSTMATPEAHFATFPLELPELCMKAGCPEGGTVLDPFAGAGTTGLACLKNGRAFVGIELNPAYVEIAHQRARKYYPLLVGA